MWDGWVDGSTVVKPGQRLHRLLNSQPVRKGEGCDGGKTREIREQEDKIKLKIFLWLVAISLNYIYILCGSAARSRATESRIHVDDNGAADDNHGRHDDVDENRRTGDTFTTTTVELWGD